MQTGVSVYLANDFELTRSVLVRAASAGASTVFTSLHIPEDNSCNYLARAEAVVAECARLGLNLMVDVGPETYLQLGCSSLEGLADKGITHLRLDYGFNPHDVAQLSQHFIVVANASTLSYDDLTAWKKAGARLDHLCACHNFYPKPYTGLSAHRVFEINAWLHAHELEVFGFIPGNNLLRGPLHEGLPTLEHHRARKNNVALNALELTYDCGCDHVLIGDANLTETAWLTFSEFSKGYVSVHAQLDDSYTYLYGQIQHDRPDPSEWLFRSQESRTNLRAPFAVEPDQLSENCLLQPGDIVITNSSYARYEGEVEIIRQQLALTPHMKVIGHLEPADVPLIQRARPSLGIVLVRSS